MPKKSGKTFRLAFVRRRIHTMFKSRELKAALLAELNGGQDAALVVQMVEKVTPIAKPPIQAVAPLPQQSEEEEEAPATPVNPPTPVEAPPPVRPVVNLPKQRLLGQPPLMGTQLQQQCRYLTLTVTVIKVIKRHLVNFVFIWSVVYLLLLCC